MEVLILFQDSKRSINREHGELKVYFKLGFFKMVVLTYSIMSRPNIIGFELLVLEKSENKWSLVIGNLS